MICDLHAFIQQVPLFEPGYQKLSIGPGKTKVSDQIVDVFLVREVWPSPAASIRFEILEDRESGPTNFRFEPKKFRLSG